MKQSIGWQMARVGLLAALVLPGLTLAQDATTVEGEVIEVQQHVRTQAGATMDHLMIRTREGTQVRLCLGEGGTLGSQAMAGDQVRARVMSGTTSEGALKVQTMKVRRTGQTLKVRDASGELLQTRARLQDGSGAGMGTQERARDRVHEPGTGDCTGPGAGSGSGSMHGGGGSMHGGSGSTHGGHGSTHGGTSGHHGGR